jgi:hypothetical protein
MPPIPIPTARDLGMLVSEAQGQRSRGKRTLTQGNQILPPGTLLTGGAPATVGTAVDGILLYWADPTAGPVDAPTLERDCEVNDAYLVRGTMVLADVTTALAKSHIIVREGVLTGPGGTFATPNATDPALANSIFGPKGLTALPSVSGGVGGEDTTGGGGDTTGGGAETYIYDGEARTLSDGRVTPVLPTDPPPTPPNAPSQGAGQTDAPTPGGGASTVSGATG